MLAVGDNQGQRFDEGYDAKTRRKTAIAGRDRPAHRLDTDGTEMEEEAASPSEATKMTDWSTCPAVERKPGKVSGAWVFAGTRIPLHALYENLACGATIDEFVEWFPGVDAQQVQCVLEFEAEALRNALAR